MVNLKNNYLKNGHIKYKFKRILLDNSLNNNYLYTHDEILQMLKNWNGSTNQNRKHLLLRSNYPWLFSSRNEIRNNENLNEHKILPIIALSEIGRKSLSALKNIILHDKYAHIIELLTHVKVFRKWSKALSKHKTNTISTPCLVHGINIMMKKKLMYTRDSLQIPTFLDCRKILEYIYNNDEIRLCDLYDKLLDYYDVQHDSIMKILSSTKSIHFIRHICEIVLGNNRKIISYLQGKESAVRTAVPKRVLSCRAQICLAPHLRANQIGIPYWWAKYCNFAVSPHHDDSIKIYNHQKICQQMPQEYLYELQGQRILAKRDPIIHILAFCIFDTVYFHADSRFWIGSESLKKMAADFDGDTFILYFVDDLQVLYELDLSASIKYSMTLHGQCRINLIESIVLSMYARDVVEKIPYWHLYNFIRDRLTYKWLHNIRNCSTLEAIEQISMGKFSLTTLYNMVEPTNMIINEVLIIVYMLYGSQQAHMLYCRILELCMELSIKFEKAVLYQKNLPCIYTLTDDLLNFNLLAISFSGAKGNIHTYKSLLDKVYENDKNTSLCTNTTDDNFDYEKLIGDITNANIFAAKKSKQVPQQGYNLFKDTIEGDLMSFGANNFNYNNEVLIEDIYLRIPLQYILRPSIAYTILFAP